MSVHEQGRKHSQPWCLTHDVPMVCSCEVEQVKAAVRTLREACEAGSWNCFAAGDREGVEFFDAALAETEQYR
jgi:hypothetical protein